MKKKVLFSFLLVAVSLIVACNPSHDKQQSEIEQAEKSLPMDVTTDTVAANQLVKLYLQFVDRFPDDTLSPLYLFKAANLMVGMGHLDQAVGTFDRVIDNYPDFGDMPLCYVFKAMALENASRPEEAAKTYEVFLQQFPDHFLATSISALLPMVRQGMSAEQQLEEITK